MKHFLYGTSNMLRLRGPEAHLSGSGRSFFLTVRVFEICRALIYPEPTFLCRPEWMFSQGGSGTSMPTTTGTQKNHCLI